MDHAGGKGGHGMIQRTVIPANAGIHRSRSAPLPPWAPAFAGVTGMFEA